MMNNKKLGIIGLLSAVVVAGALIYNDMKSVERVVENEPPMSATTTSSMYGVNVAGNGTITQVVPLDVPVKLPPAPILDRLADPKNSLSSEAREIVRARIKALVTDLKKDTKDVNNWIFLGAEWKALGDFAYARDVWEYAKAINPSYYLSYNNLGDLYHYYLKDFKKSEENWKKSFELKPDHIMGYYELAKLYEYSLKEKSSEIPKVLSAGIAKNPKAVDLAVDLARYYRDIGNTEEATSAYERAIKIAQEIGNQTLAGILKEELATAK
jgi:tetratricopeptide (TPR) repeat protein